MRVLNKNSLQLLAVFFMLLDHLWAWLVSGNNWMTYAGRMAFPIFAFLIAEGYAHTSDRRKYAKRLLIFALISEIPFNLFYAGGPFFPFHQNTIFTLLLGLLAIACVERVRQADSLKGKFKQGVLLFLIFLFSLLGFPDYGYQGVLMVLAFHLVRGVRWEKVGQLATMVLINIVLFEGMVIPVDIGGLHYEFPTQGFAVLALIPIWLYNGKAGKKSKILQYGFYVFYPLHMIILYMLRRMI